MKGWQGAGGSYGSQLAGRKKASEEYHSSGGGGSGGSKAGAIIATILVGIVVYGILTSEGDVTGTKIVILIVGVGWVGWLWSR